MAGSDPKTEVGRTDVAIDTPTAESQYPGVRPEVARLLVEMDPRERVLRAGVERATAQFNRLRGIVGKQFGLRTSVR